MDFSKIVPKVTLGQVKEIDASKLNAPAPRSRYQKEKDEAKAKAKQQEVDTEKAYSEFLQEFEAETEQDQGSSSSKYVGKGFVRAGGDQVYRPAQASHDTRRQEAPQDAQVFSLQKSTFEREASPPAGSRKKRKMDSFLEELKRDQAVRETRLAGRADSANMSVSALAAAETGGEYNDPHTTNVHIHPIPANVCEQDLGFLFSKFGSVGTVKIMWPREEAFSSMAGQKRTRSAGLGGFVCMMDRKAAERAMKGLEGYDWLGCTLRMTWGKSMPIPYRPAFVATDEGMFDSQRRSRSPSPRLSADDAFRAKKRRSHSPHARGSRGRTPPRDWPILSSRQEETFLEEFARKIRSRGHKYEQVVRRNEKDNPLYAFLFDETLPNFHYFKMLLDDTYVWSAPIEFDDEGNMSIESSTTESESEGPRQKTKANKMPMKRSVRQKLAALLRTITCARATIARTMAFALENAEWSDEISDMIAMSIMLPATPLQRKVARLYLLSDILANSSNALPSAWKYRSTFEEKLVPVFTHLNQIYRSFPGRMKAEAFKQQILGVVHHWEASLVFTPSVIEDLIKRLVDGENSAEDVEGEVIADSDVSEATAINKSGAASSTPVTNNFRSLKAVQVQQDANLDGDAIDVDGMDGNVMLE